MARLLVMSTAVLALASASVLAQEASKPAPQSPATVQEPLVPPVPATGAVDAPAPAAEAAPVAGPAPEPVPEQTERQVRAESLLGVDVSNGPDTIGRVSDLVVTEDGRVEAIVVGIGGFLGIGEKRVALAWDSIKLTEQDGERMFLVSATREQLEGMPTFKTLEEKQAEADAAAVQQQQQQPGATSAITPIAPTTTPPPAAQPPAQ